MSARSRLSPNTVRPEPVEGLSFFFLGRKKREGFDKLSPNGVGVLACALSLALAACSNAPPGGAAGAFGRGAAAFEAGDYRSARIELLNAFQANPGDVRTRLLQARTFLALRDGVGAESELLRARALGAPDAQTAHLLAHALVLQDKPQDALREAARAAPQFAGYAARMQGRAYQALGDTVAAAAAFERAAAARPEDAELWTDIGRFRRGAGDMAGAVEAADRAVALDYQSADALTLRGELTRSQYGLEAALPWFDRALALDGENVVALLERAATNGDLGRNQAMLADAREALALAPGNPRAFFLMATIAARGRDFALARSLYERTGRAFDGQPSGMLLASAIDFGSGNVQAAAERLARLVAMQPDNRRARRLLAAAQWRQGNHAALIETLRPIVDRPDADSYSLTLMGRALARRNDRRTASHYLSRAAQPARAATALNLATVDDAELLRLRIAADQQPDNAQAQVALVAALLGRGVGPEALDRARRLQAANPGAPDAHILVGDALGITGDFAGAAEIYRLAANIAFTEPVAMRMIEALRSAGDQARADQVLSLFLQQNPHNLAAQHLLAGRHMQARNWPQAIALYEGLRRRIGNNDATILNNLAWSYSELRDFEQAIPLARRAWELDRANPVTADTYGWILFKSGRDRAGGLALLQRAARGAPTDADILRRLEQARGG